MPRDGGDAQLVDVGVEYAVHEANAGALVGVLVGQLDMDLPQTAGEGCWVCQLRHVSGTEVSAYSLLVP